MSLRSLIVNSTGGASVTVWSMPPAPTITVVPPLRVDQMHDSMTGPAPDRVERVVDTDAAGELLHRAEHIVGDRDRSRRSRRSASPSRRRSATGSETMIFVAPATRAPCTIEMPMPPAPATSTVAPSGTRAVLSTAPTPVCTAQPITHAMSSGVSSATLIAPVSVVITNSANPPSPTPRSTGRPWRESGVRPSMNVPVLIDTALTQQPYSPRTHQ